MSPLGSTCTRASQDGLTCSCSMYTNPTNVPEESAEPILSFEADTENIPSYLGNTLVSLFGYVHGDICLMYILGIPQGWSLGARPGLLPPHPDRRNNSVPRRPRHYVRSTHRLGCTDRQIAPSGVIDPLRTSPEILPGLLAYVSGMLVLPHQVGVLGGVPPSTYRRARRLPPPQAVAFY